MWRRNLYVSWVTQVISLAGFGLVLPFVPFYIQELGVTDPAELRLWTGFLASGPALTMAIMAPVWGVIADRHGKKIMLLRAMFFGALILGLMSFVRSVTGVLVLRIIQGAVTGTVGASAALVATVTPREKMSYALGFLSSSNFIGISLGPLIGGVVAEWIGYRSTFRIGALLLVVGFFLVLFLIDESPAGDSGDEAEDEGARATLKSQLASILTFSMVSLFLLVLVLRFVRTLPVAFIPLYIQEMRGRLEGSAGVTGILSAARGAVTAVAALTLTRLGDRHPRLLLATVFLGVGALFSLPVFFARSLWSFSVLLVAATFFLGGIEPLIQSDLSARTPPGRRGLLFGVQTTISNMGWFAAPLVGSWVSITLGIRYIFLTVSIFLFITMVLSLVIHRSRRRNARLTPQAR